MKALILIALLVVALSGCGRVEDPIGPITTRGSVTVTSPSCTYTSLGSYKWTNSSFPGTSLMMPVSSNCAVLNNGVQVGTVNQPVESSLILTFTSGPFPIGSFDCGFDNVSVPHVISCYGNIGTFIAN